MNIFLWIVQALLAFFCLSGGGWKLFKQDQLLPPSSKALPPIGWSLIGALEMLGAIALLIPATSLIAAWVLGIEGILMAAFYARFSTRFAATNPMVFALLQVALAGCVAYGRGMLSPF